MFVTDEMIMSLNTSSGECKPGTTHEAVDTVGLCSGGRTRTGDMRVVTQLYALRSRTWHYSRTPYKTRHPVTSQTLNVRTRTFKCQ